MVLSRTISDLSTDRDACGSLEKGKQEKATAKIDSLFAHYMELYHIKVDYVYELKPSIILANNSNVLATQLLPSQQRCYRQNVAGLTNMELKLIFPDKIQYVVAEMGPTFVSSVLLILVVLYLSWQSLYSLMREKRLAEQTTEFLGNMTHELRTPLTNIGLAGKMLIRESTMNDAEKIKQYAGIMLSENEKLSSQIDQVLGISALEHGELSLKKEPIDLNALVNEALSAFTLQIQTKSIKLSAALGASRSRVNGDPLFLRHAICNLIDNAIKYSPESSKVEGRYR